MNVNNNQTLLATAIYITSLYHDEQHLSSLFRSSHDSS